MSVSDQRSQREVVEAAVVEAVATVLHDHGPMNGQDEASERWQDCPNGEIHGAVADKVASTTVVQALLDVIEAARSLLNDHAHAPVRSGQGDWDEWAHYAEININELLEALARLPEEVRRG